MTFNGWYAIKPIQTTPAKKKKGYSYNCDIVQIIEVFLHNAND